MSEQHQYTGSEIAIIGIACRFPGADTPAKFWQNLVCEKESIIELSDQELIEAGVTPAEFKDPNYVRAASVLDNVEYFDAGFFGFSPLEAEITDVQQRIFLECAHEALENAGYNTTKYPEPVGVFAGARTNTYITNIIVNPDLFKSLGVLQVSVGNDLASLATNTSFKLNLKGPSYAIHTACSTSLVAVHLARQSLLLEECRLALAGAVAVNVPHRIGYHYDQGGILSPDGHVRSFDAAAQGTLFGSGAGVVVLKRLEDALEDGDYIRAVIKGSATNNDGSVKATFTAPSVDGQASVIADAIFDAEVSHESIRYIEAHATGTALGDPIEMRALNKVFRPHTQKQHFCAVGSVKSNLGHLDAAAGMPALLKTILALQHAQIPATINFNSLNPRIDFENSPFYVNAKLKEWEKEGTPRRAGVSSFGFGGTNAHIILEEAPQLRPSGHSREYQLLIFSAKTETALESYSTNLTEYLEKNPALELADVAYTLQIGRQEFEHRRFLLCPTVSEAVSILKSGQNLVTGRAASEDRPLVFLFNGKTNLPLATGKDLYRSESVFKEAFDACADIVKNKTDQDLRELLYQTETATVELAQSPLAACALVGIEYALARLFMAWGVKPQALLGQGLGEYAAAALANVMSLENALKLSLSLENAEGEIQADDLQAPEVPLISSKSGTWITDEEVRDPGYWTTLLPSPDTVERSIRTLLEETEYVFLETGSGSSLNNPVNNHSPGRFLCFRALDRTGHDCDNATALNALGRLWLNGVSVDWRMFSAAEKRSRLPLPTYPFERQKYWIDPVQPRFNPNQERASAPAVKNPDINQWFYQPVWKSEELAETESPSSLTENPATWIIFLDGCGVGEDLAALLKEKKQTIITVSAGKEFEKRNNDQYAINPGCLEDYQTLARNLAGQGHRLDNILHLWTVTPDEKPYAARDEFDQAQNLGFYSLIYLIRALGDNPLRITAISNHTQEVHENDLLSPGKATIQGACIVIPQEHLKVTCYSLDITLSDYKASREVLLEKIIRQTSGSFDDSVIAYRDSKRLVKQYRQLDLTQTQTPGPVFKNQGIYVITGGLGGIGRLLSQYLARTKKAKLVLTSRSGLVHRSEWEEWLDSHAADDPVSEKIKTMRAIEALGGEVIAVQADAADSEQMRRVFDQAEMRFGKINGVIHCAGITSEEFYHFIQQTDRENAQIHFRSKALGLFALEQALADRRVDFCFLQSSLAAVIGGLSYIAYSAANLFMDVFACQKNKTSSFPWIAVNWDSWHNETNLRTGSAIGATLTDLAITPEEGLTAFNTALSLGRSQVVVSTSDLHARIDQWIKLAAIRGQSIGTPGQADIKAGQLPDRVELEQIILKIWQKVLGKTDVGINDNFFDLGGDSLSSMQLISEFKRELQIELPPVVLFEAPNISALVSYLLPEDTTSGKKTDPKRLAYPKVDQKQSQIAVISMTGRFPGADNVEQFWQNLRDGVESIAFFSDLELEKAGVSRELLDNPQYVRARPILNNVDLFDASFFGYSPKEAQLMDPQHRLFLECVHEAIELAGYDTERYQGKIGMFGGAAISSYLLNLYSNQGIIDKIDPLQTVIGNDKDALTTTISYKLNLKGPSLAVQTFCSTSLVALHLACQSLIQGESDMALAGGVTILLPQRSGYLFQSDGILSPDGHNRAFDADARGTVFGNGVAVVMLKRLSDALQDGDTILAVIRGSAINNDGALKAGYTAPSVEGQTQVILQAQQVAGVSPEDIGYLEAHGTGTALGDPIEITALTKAFRTKTDKRGYCPIGSLKTNVGHLDRAGGVAALMKTILAMQYQLIPPSLHYSAPNPKIDFANSPFYVNTELQAWESTGKPRIAGVSALGFGGTNAHVIVEEAPLLEPTGPDRDWYLLPLSAKADSALENAIAQLKVFLSGNRDINLADVAYTLQVGRSQYQYRHAVLCRTTEEAVSALSGESPDFTLSVNAEPKNLPVIFLCSPQQTGDIKISRELYDNESIFKKAVDECLALLDTTEGPDLEDRLFTGVSYAEDMSLANSTRFISEYALGALFMAWGIKPESCQGVGIGSITARILGGKLSLADAVKQIPDYIPGESADADREAFVKQDDRIYLELGPGDYFTKIFEADKTLKERILITPFSNQPPGSDTYAAVIKTLGLLWLHGLEIEWETYYQEEKRRRIPLPTYPFERQKYWIDTDQRFVDGKGRTLTAAKPARHQMYISSWGRSPLYRENQGKRRELPQNWLLFTGKNQTGKDLARYLKTNSRALSLVAPGGGYTRTDQTHYLIRPDASEDYDNLLSDLQSNDHLPHAVLYLWDLEKGMADATFTSLLLLLQALEKASYKQGLELWIISSMLYTITGEESRETGKQAVTALLKTINREYPHIHCRNIDLGTLHKNKERVGRRIIREIETGGLHLISAYRGNYRWLPVLEPYPSAADESDETEQVYLFAGPLQELSFKFAHSLAQTGPAKIIFIEPETANGKQQADRWNPDYNQQIVTRIAAATRLKHKIKALPEDMKRSTDELCTGYICEYLNANGMEIKKGAVYNRTILQQRLRILPKYEKIYNFMLRTLKEDKIITLTEERIEFIRDLSDISPVCTIKEHLNTAYPNMSLAFDGLEFCVGHYNGILTGEEDAVSVLYPGGSSDMMNNIYDKQLQYSNLKNLKQTSAAVLAHVTDNSDRPLKILEIGAGEGNLTWELLKAIPHTKFEYYYTDITRAFIVNGEKYAREQHYDCMKFRLLDISRAPWEQGFNKYDFDIIIAGDVLHSTRNIHSSLTHIRALLKPGALLIMIEAEKADRWANMVWGLLDGWWNFEDEALRSHSPLLPARVWEEQLSGLDFTNIAVISGEQEDDYALLVAQQPQEIKSDDYRAYTTALMKQKQDVQKERETMIAELQTDMSLPVFKSADLISTGSLQAVAEDVRDEYGKIHTVFCFPQIEQGDENLSNLSPAVCSALFTEIKEELAELEKALLAAKADSYLAVLPYIPQANYPGRTLTLARESYFGQEDNGNLIPWNVVVWQNRDERYASPEETRIIRSLSGLDQGIRTLIINDGTDIVMNFNAVVYQGRKKDTKKDTVDENFRSHRHPRPHLSYPYVAPENPIEKDIAEMWGDVLGIDKVGLYDNFMDLGGDSLQATQLVSKLRSDFHIDLSLQKFFAASNLTGLVTIITDLQRDQEDKDALEVLAALEELSPDEVLDELAKRK